MEQYLIDNNVISSLFSDSFSEKALVFINEIIDQKPRISVITEIEALSWISLDKNKEAIVKAFVNDSNIVPLTPSIIAECINLRRTKKIKTPDAIIAATAIIQNLTLLTSDRDFKNIPHLKMVDPHEI